MISAAWPGVNGSTVVNARMSAGYRGKNAQSVWTAPFGLIQILSP
jgi:hypothetical protein